MLDRCDYCRDVGKQASVRCLKGLFGGLPHIGVCRARCPDCKGYSPAPRRRRNLPAYVSERRRICAACDADSFACWVKGDASCGQRRAFWSDPAEQCELDPPKWGPRPMEIRNDT